MTEPTPSTYWRRRAVAVGGALMVLVLVGWALTGFFEDTVPTAQRTGVVDEVQPPSSPPSSRPGDPAASSSATAPPSSPATAPPPPTTTAPAQQPTTPPPPPPPDPRLPCPDPAIGLTVELGAPQYRVGQRPALRLVVTNTGQVPCTRDISRPLREIVVTSADGATRIWSSNDCYQRNQQQARVVQPGERLVFEVQWAGRTSAPGCPAKRITVPAGAYSVVGKLGPLTSPPVPLVLS